MNPIWLRIGRRPEQSRGRIGFLGALALLLIGLKLYHVIDWPWLWVLSPLWMPLVVFLAVLVLMSVLVVVIDLLDQRITGGSRDGSNRIRD